MCLEPLLLCTMKLKIIQRFFFIKCAVSFLQMFGLKPKVLSLFFLIVTYVGFGATKSVSPWGKEPLPKQLYPHELKNVDLNKPVVYFPQPFSFPGYPVILYL